MPSMAPSHPVVMNIWTRSFGRCEWPFVSSNATIRGRHLTGLVLPLRNPEWGLPDVDVLRQLAYGNGLRMERMVSHAPRASLQTTL